MTQNSCAYAEIHKLEAKWLANCTLLLGRGTSLNSCLVALLG